MQVTISHLRKDMLIRYEGEWYRILDFEQVSRGRERPSIRIELQQEGTGEEREIRLPVGEEVELFPGERRPCDFLYQDGDQFVFLNPATLDEVPFPAERFGEARRLVKPGMVVEGILVGDELVSVSPPYSVELTVKETSDTISGAYSARGWKMAMVETGARVEVPRFVEPGDLIKVNTKTGEYIERVQVA